LSFISQVNINSTTNLQNGNNANNAFTATNQYTGTASDYIGVKGSSLQKADWGVGGDFSGGFTGVHGAATLGGSGCRGGFFEAANTPSGIQYGVQSWSYNSAGTKYGVWGGAWGTTGTNYGVCGSTGGDPGYGVYCIGNGAATGTWTWASDEKLKTNIQPVGSVLAKIKQLNAVTYNYDVAKYPKMGFDGNKKIGFTAQNVETVFPELVRNEICPSASMPKDGKDVKGAPADSSTSYKGVDYIGLIPVLLNAIQEQQKQIDALTAKMGK
jgi:hypothetical protein